MDGLLDVSVDYREQTVPTHLFAVAEDSCGTASFGISASDPSSLERHQ